MDKKNMFRKNLVKRRKALGLTQEQLAQRMGVSPQAVSKWENTSYPDVELLPQLAKVLGTSLDSLFGVRTADEEIDLPQLVHDALQSTAPEKRPEYLMQLFYTIICADDPASLNAAQLRHDHDRETFAGFKTDRDVTLARLTNDLRYFFYIETPEDGVNQYFSNSKNMVRLFNTLADEDAIRIISYLGSGMRNKMHSVSVISRKLSIPEEKVQDIIDRMDRFGLVWRVCVDLEEGETIMYGFTHNQAVTMILILAESISNYLTFWDFSRDDFSFGMYKDETGQSHRSIPDVRWWDENEI